MHPKNAYEDVSGDASSYASEDVSEDVSKRCIVVVENLSL
jgi:hypothetical protein